jgi:site-specific DNA-methyltransferase (adenine-specific)
MTTSTVAPVLPAPYYDQDGITLYHGDCLDIMASFPSEAATMIFTDPPYGHSNHDGDLNARLNDHRSIESKPIANDSPEAFRFVLNGMLIEAARILKKDCCCCCCGGGPKPTFAWVANRMDTGGLSFFHSVIWDKVNPGLGWRYRRQHEMIMVAHREGGKLSWGDGARAVPNIFKMSPPRDRQHPNEKPLELATHFIVNHTSPGDMVIDPFMGSGTTLVAAKQLGRRAIGIELDEQYCKIAVERLAQGCLGL